MDRRPSLLLALLVTTAIVVGTFPATAREPPQPVCGVCTESLDRAAASHGITLVRGESEMRIQALPNGTSRVRADVHLEGGSRPLDNDTLRRAIVEDVRYRVFEDRDGLETRIDGHTLVVTYLARNTSHTTLGVLRFDAFVARDPPPFVAGGEGTPYPGADILTLHPPEGYRVHGSYGDASNASTVVWYGDSHTQFGKSMGRDTIVSFARIDSLAPGIRVELAGFVDWATSLG